MRHGGKAGIAAALVVALGLAGAGRAMAQAKGGSRTSPAGRGGPVQHYDNAREAVKTWTKDLESVKGPEKASALTLVGGVSAAADAADAAHVDYEKSVEDNYSIPTQRKLAEADQRAHEALIRKMQECGAVVDKLIWAAKRVPTDGKPGGGGNPGPGTRPPEGVQPPAANPDTGPATPKPGGGTLIGGTTATNWKDWHKQMTETLRRLNDGAPLNDAERKNHTRTIVRYTVNRDKTFTDIGVVKSSGDPTFDLMATDLVKSLNGAPSLTFPTSDTTTPSIHGQVTIGLSPKANVDGRGLGDGSTVKQDGPAPGAQRPAPRKPKR